jgi:hypothetical protein
MFPGGEVMSVFDLMPTLKLTSLAVPTLMLLIAEVILAVGV